MSRKSKATLRTVGFHLFCLLFAITALYPILWLLASSLKESSQVFIDAYSLVPKWKFENYLTGWRGFGGITFSTFFGNTFVVVMLSVLGTLVSCPMIAYAFSRLHFPLRNFWFVTVMVSLMLPAQIVLVPQYVLFDKLGFVNTFVPLILPTFFGSAFFIFQHMQFIRTIPIELDEAACIDGCSKPRTFVSIILPLIKASLITSVIFQFYWKWDDFFAPLIYLNRPVKYTVSIALRLFADPTTKVDWGAMFAMGALSLIPPMLVFFIFQKYIVEGIATSGLKG